MPVDQRVKAGKIWPTLVELASAKKTATYTELGPKLGIVRRNLTPPLEVIAKHCQRMNWPPLTAIVVPTDGGIADAEAVMRVHEFDWARVKNPFELFLSTN